MRVVAWHNRHPLARRINTLQVHSIGVVVLPFATARPSAGLAGPVGLPGATELLYPIPGQAPIAWPTDPAPGAFAAHLAATRARCAARQAGPAADRADAQAIGTDTSPAPAEADLALHLDAVRVASAAAQPVMAGRPPGRLARARARLTLRQTGLPRLKAVFSSKFLWPLSPRQVARWAQRHGSLQALAPNDWPRRVVETDAQGLAAARRQGLNHGASLHLLTAAIGIDDRRIRLLMDAQGAILGARAYSGPRQAIAGGLIGLALLAVGWDRWPASAQAPVPHTAARAETVASAPVAAALAAAQSAPAPMALTGSAPVAIPTPAAGQTDGEPAAETAREVALSASETPAGAAVPEASRKTRGEHPDKPTAGSDPSPKPRATAARDTSNDTTPNTLGQILPLLSPENRQAARQQAIAMRGRPVLPAKSPQPGLAAAAGTAYAVVSRPERRRETAAISLALMRSVGAKMPPPVPSHGDLMQSQGAWRAAWWPFASPADAERARVLLISKGLKTEVVSF